MRNRPVHWSEGMFLRPQHFQAADRYWTEALGTSESWDHAYNYGIRAIDISKEAIANYQVQLNLCQARMKDGTLVSLDPGQLPDRAELKDSITDLKQLVAQLADAFDQEAIVRIYLALPKIKMGSANVGTAADPGKHRFWEDVESVQDETRGGNDQEIQLRNLNVRLLLSTQELTGYDLLPIGQIQRTGEGEATPKLDDDYFPPMLSIDAWPPLGRGVVRAIYDLIGQKIEVLSEQVLNRGITLAAQEPGDLDRLLMLMHLNEAYAKLGVMTFAAGVHPYPAYTELCRILGSLSIFGKARRPPEIPRYDHDDLARIFYYVKSQIELLMDSVKDYQYEQRFFVGVGKGMQVSLEAKWLNASWDWFVGVDRGTLSEKDCRQLLSAGELDWKLGSSRQVEILFRTRAEGVHLVPLEQAPRALPSQRSWIYYQVSRQNAAWKDVQETQTLAMRLKESLIVNLDELQGQRSLIVNSRGKPATLQFALFAVPNR